jgi:alkylation response protein AidB-like acyl-CoA dehydrogenase
VNRAVSTAKAVAGEAGVRNGESCVPVFGGMGFTWEADPHLFLKRAWALDALFGSSDEHARRVGGLLA